MTSGRRPPPGIRPATRRDVFARDGGVCAECGGDSAPCKIWHHDHERPLWQAAFATDPAWFWSLENSQTLCTLHHDRKTRREATMRAKEKRLRAKAAGLVTRRKAKIRSRPFPKIHHPLRKRIDANKTPRLASSRLTKTKRGKR